MHHHALSVVNLFWLLNLNELLAQAALTAIDCSLCCVAGERLHLGATLLPWSYAQLDVLAAPHRAELSYPGIMGGAGDLGALGIQ